MVITNYGLSLLVKLNNGDIALVPEVIQPEASQFHFHHNAALW